MPEAPPRRCRRWWLPRLSLRTLMVLVLVVGAPIGWVARRAAIQRRAVARLEALGGSVKYWGILPFREPAWLKHLVGDEPFQEVAVAIFNSESSNSDDSVAVLRDFPALEALSLNGFNSPDDSQARPVTAVGLAKLAGLTKLLDLELAGLNVDEAVMRRLPQWPRLEGIGIRNSRNPIPAASLRFLGDLPRLQRIDIDNLGPSGGNDLATLARLTQLNSVFLKPSPRSDAGLANLAAPALTRLILPETELTEATISALVAQNPNLEFLWFDGSRLAPGSLRALSRAKRLISLKIRLGGRSTQRTIDPPHFGDDDLDALRTVPLLSLMIDGLDATDAGVTRFLASHSLTSITLSGHGVTDATATALAGQTKLKSVVLHQTGITATGLTQLKTLPIWHSLGLYDNPRLTPVGIAALQFYPDFVGLTLRQPGVTPAVLDAIRAAHPSIQLNQLPEPPH